MFGLISTKDLYIVELSTYRCIDFSNFPFCKYIIDKYKRYALCKKKGLYYCDIFTSTNYNPLYLASEGEDCVTRATVVTISKKYLTKKEAIETIEYINAKMKSQELNETTTTKDEKTINSKKLNKRKNY